MPLTMKVPSPHHWTTKGFHTAPLPSSARASVAVALGLSYSGVWGLAEPGIRPLPPALAGDSHPLRHQGDPLLQPSWFCRHSSWFGESIYSWSQSGAEPWPPALFTCPVSAPSVAAAEPAEPSSLGPLGPVFVYVCVYVFGCSGS